MLKNSIFLSILLLFLSTSDGKLVTRFDSDVHPCETLEEDEIWATNPRGCSLYYWCSEYPGEIGLGECPEGYHFHQESQTCNLPEVVGCDIDNNNWDVTCKGNSGRRIPHPYSCSEYTVCIDNLEADFTCPNDLHFSPYDQECVEPSITYCPRDSETCRGSKPYVPSYTPSSRNCRAHYICFNDYLTRLLCGPKQHWNNEKHWCEDEANNVCDTSGNIPEDTDIPSSLTMDCTSIENGTSVPHPESCRFWFWCIEDRSQLFWCGQDSLFDSASLTCTGTEHAQCFYPSTTTVTTITDDSSSTDDPSSTSTDDPVPSVKYNDDDDNIVIIDTFPMPPVRQGLK